MQLPCRPRVDDLEAILGKKYPVLDHGFLRLVDYMGNDTSIVQAARVSHGAGSKRVSDDRGLIRYLMRHDHGTPFEMCVVKFHVKLPIFVARQWVRHRMASINEISARYSILEDDYYIPEEDAVKGPSPHKRQGRQAPLPLGRVRQVQESIDKHARAALDLYHDFLNAEGDNPALARESARMALPLNLYTEWYWKTDLRNLFHFLQLRMAAEAQAEIRAYAQVILDLVWKWVPLAAEAFRDYRLEARTLSQPVQEIIRRWLAGDKIDQDMSGLTPGEWRETIELLKSLGIILPTRS